MKNPLGKGLKDLARPGDRKAVERMSGDPNLITVELTLDEADALIGRGLPDEDKHYLIAIAKLKALRGPPGWRP